FVFFQAEDGIRDRNVTGVQTCALPISIIPVLNISANARISMPIVLAGAAYIAMIYAGTKRYGFGKYVKSSLVIPNLPPALHLLRSEERRVGREGWSRVVSEGGCCGVLR